MTFSSRPTRIPNAWRNRARTGSRPDAPTFASILADALHGRIKALWIFGHDLLRSSANSEVKRCVAHGRPSDLLRHERESPAAAAHWVLPSAAYLEKDGSFVNFHGRVQRIGRALPPLPGSREDWTLLLDIARRLDRPLGWRSPKEIFLAMAKTVAAFEGLTYEAMGSHGIPIRQ